MAPMEEDEQSVGDEKKEQPKEEEDAANDDVTEKMHEYLDERNKEEVRTLTSVWEKQLCYFLKTSKLSPVPAV
jgi:hypothetical protein